MFTSQIRKFISVGATRNASADISSGSKSIVHSFPTADTCPNISKFWLKPTTNATTISPIFTKAVKRFHSTACNEIKVKSTVNDNESMIESSITFPAKNQISKESILALKYIAIQMNNGRWNETEKNKFKTKLMELSLCLPMDAKVFFQKLSDAVGSRTAKQCKQHHDYHYKRIDIVA